MENDGINNIHRIPSAKTRDNGDLYRFLGPRKQVLTPALEESLSGGNPQTSVAFKSQPVASKSSGRDSFGYVWDWTTSSLTQRSEMASRVNMSIQQWHGDDPPTFIAEYLRAQLVSTNKLRAQLNEWFSKNSNVVMSPAKTFDVMFDHMNAIAKHGAEPAKTLAEDFLSAVYNDNPDDIDLLMQSVDRTKEQMSQLYDQQQADLQKKRLGRLRLEEVRKKAASTKTSHAQLEDEFEMVL